jgi:hypothetical protein
MKQIFVRFNCSRIVLEDTLILQKYAGTYNFLNNFPTWSVIVVDDIIIISIFT